jgi:hypothetical protein
MSTEVSVSADEDIVSGGSKSSSSCSANVILLFDDLDSSRQFKLVTANGANELKALLERLLNLVMLLS